MSGASAVGPRYRILRRLGQGGMAEVFEAELAGELGFARRVAIKRMLGDAAADPQAARRFLDEARIASRLHHASILAVTDVGLLDDLPFQVLELVDGLDGARLLQRAGGRLPIEVALAIAREVARALEHAHAARDAAGAPLGVVHRDVKPSNVLVSWAGDVKLADFGIALARDRAARTETGGITGTLGFMAPEQRLRGEVDGRSDVFALGLTLHALIAGGSPLSEPGAELAVLSGEPVPLDPDLPDDVRRLIARAAAPARLDRPSAGELARQLAAALAARLPGGDARGAIRDFVEPLAARRPAAGALDHLLGVAVVPEDGGGDGGGEVARFRTVATVVQPAPAFAPAPAAVPAPAPAPVPAPAPAAGIAPAEPAAAPARPGRRLAALSIAALAFAGVGLGIWRLAASSEGAPPASLAIVTVDAAPALATAAPVPPPADARVAPAMIDAAPAAAPPRPATSPPSSPRPRPPARPPRPAPPDAAIATTVAPAETGWLLVYGDELVGARVVIDGGRWSGSVPNPIEVAAGRRSVAVIRRDGTRLPPKQVDVASFHSAVRPLRLTW